MSGAKITVVVLTLNEEARVGRAVRSLAPLTGQLRLVVVDSESKDTTLAVAEAEWRASGGAERDLALVVRPWRGFVEARNASLEWARTPWVLWLDSDEWLSPELARELAELPASPPADFPAAFRIPRQSYFLGRAIRHGGWFPDRKARLAQSGCCEWKGGPKGADVHEDLAAASWGLLRGTIEHEPFRDAAEQEETNRRYSALLAEGHARDLRARGKRAPSRVYSSLRVLWKFFENYVWKLGFLDGFPGLRIAWGSAQSLGWRYARTRALLARGKGSP
jgi:glycosyltransferase involved in cell wall biosynthesis